MTDGDQQWRIGCQARPWLQRWGRETLAARLPEVMSRLAAIGYAGFETTMACLPLDDPDQFHQASKRANDIALCAGHAGGPWWDPDATEAIPAIAENAARLPALGCTRLAVSMHPLPDDLSTEQINRGVETLGRLGRHCREVGGVQVVFHNHAGELANDARIIAAIVEQCPPEDVALGPDLGWVAHAGADVVPFVERFGDRIGYVHVRDVTGGDDAGFIEMGRGVLDHQVILGALAGAGYAGWLTVESEFGDLWCGVDDPEETVRLQHTGLREILGK